MQVYMYIYIYVYTHIQCWMAALCSCAVVELAVRVTHCLHRLRYKLSYTVRLNRDSNPDQKNLSLSLSLLLSVRPAFPLSRDIEHNLVSSNPNKTNNRYFSAIGARRHVHDPTIIGVPMHNQVYSPQTNEPGYNRAQL